MGFRDLYQDALAERPPLRLLLERAGDFEQVLASLADDQSRRVYADGLGCAGVHPVRAALWNQDGQVSFFESFAMSQGNRVGQGNVQVEAVTLDSFVKRAGIGRLDLIKLDIEGAELAALQGASETIRSFRPRLQICLYHQFQDLWELPLFVRELVPEYRLYVGHHSPDHLDTVLYCRV